MYTEESIEIFLKEQGRLYDEPVAETVEEAEEFLEDCMAVEVKISKKSERIWMRQVQMSVECLMRNWKKHVKFLHFHPVAI